MRELSHELKTRDNAALAGLLLLLVLLKAFNSSNMVSSKNFQSNSWLIALSAMLVAMAGLWCLLMNTYRVTL